MPDQSLARSPSLSRLLAKWPPRFLISFTLSIPKTLAIIAGNGIYPQAMAQAARLAGVPRLVVVAFQDETNPTLVDWVDELQNLFNLRPDLKALFLLAKLKRRNAESIFGAIADEMSKIGVELLPATTFMEEHLAPLGRFAGPKLKKREEEDLHYGFQVAKESARLDIGQTVVIKNGTILAVEAFEGTNAAMKRGGELGRQDALMVKVSKPHQDFRFDVPVIGPLTIEAAKDSRIRAIGVEAGKTLLLEKTQLTALADQYRISIFGLNL